MGSAAPAPILSDICARCDGRMVVKKDAIGRLRVRCPKCDGVSPLRPAHPDDAMIPQGLVRVADAVLPPIRPGQLRCQRCAAGVEGRSRLCAACQRQSRVRGGQTRTGLMAASLMTAAFKPRVCRGPCGLVFTPTIACRFYCPQCRAALPADHKGQRNRRPRRAEPYRTCGGCGRRVLRTVGRPPKHCEACR